MNNQAPISSARQKDVLQAILEELQAISCKLEPVEIAAIHENTDQADRDIKCFEDGIEHGRKEERGELDEPEVRRTLPGLDDTAKIIELELQAKIDTQLEKDLNAAITQDWPAIHPQAKCVTQLNEADLRLEDGCKKARSELDDYLCLRGPLECFEGSTEHERIGEDVKPEKGPKSWHVTEVKDFGSGRSRKCHVSFGEEDHLFVDSDTLTIKKEEHVDEDSPQLEEDLDPDSGNRAWALCFCGKSLEFINPAWDGVQGAGFASVTCRNTVECKCGWVWSPYRRGEVLEIDPGEKVKKGSSTQWQLPVEKNLVDGDYYYVQHIFCDGFALDLGIWLATSKEFRVANQGIGVVFLTKVVAIAPIYMPEKLTTEELDLFQTDHNDK